LFYCCIIVNYNGLWNSAFRIFLSNPTLVFIRIYATKFTNNKSFFTKVVVSVLFNFAQEFLTIT